MTMQEEMTLVGKILEVTKDVDVKRLPKLFGMCVVYRTTQNLEKKIEFPKIPIK